jgi:hypothetical protein
LLCWNGLWGLRQRHGRKEDEMGYDPDPLVHAWCPR